MLHCPNCRAVPGLAVRIPKTFPKPKPFVPSQPWQKAASRSWYPTATAGTASTRTCILPQVALLQSPLSEAHKRCHQPWGIQIHGFGPCLRSSRARFSLDKVCSCFGGKWSPQLVRSQRTSSYSGPVACKRDSNALHKGLDALASDGPLSLVSPAQAIGPDTGRARPDVVCLHGTCVATRVPMPGHETPLLSPQNVLGRLEDRRWTSGLWKTSASSKD